MRVAPRGRRTDEPARWTWLSTIEPTKKDLESLAEMGFRREDLAHALDPHERPRVRTTKRDVLVVLRVPIAPVPNAKEMLPMSTVPFGILLGAEKGLVICAKRHDIVRDLTAFIERKEPADARSAHRVVLYAMELTASDYLRRLAELDKTIDRIEEGLRSSLENREVLSLLQHQKALMHLTVALDDMHVMLEQVEQVPILRPSADEEAWLEDVRIEVRQALATARLSSDVLSQMMDAFASMISNNLNVVMKFLASVTVVLTVPILVASFYGMNVGLPGQRTPGMFGMLLAISAAVCGVLVFLLRRRKWL